MTWIWLAMILIFSGQWVSIAFAESASAEIKLITFTFVGLQVATIVTVLFKSSRAPAISSAHLALGVSVAVPVLVMARHGGLSGPHGAAGDGLLLLLAPALSGYVGFGPAYRLIVPCIVVTNCSLAIDYLVATGGLSPGAIPSEQGITSLANLVVVWGVTRFLRRGARQADDVSERAAMLEALRQADEVSLLADQRAVSLVHDVVLHGLLAITTGGRAETRQLVEKSIQALSGPVVPARSEGELTDLSKLLSEDFQDWSARLPASFSCTSPVFVPVGVAEAFAGALAECLRNVQRHAAATRVIVSLTSDTSVRLRVADNGAGFDPEVPVPGHHGITSSVVGRIQSVGGQVVIESRPGAGTTVTMEWTPVDATEESPEAIGIAGPWSWVERLDLTPRFVWSTYFAPQLVVAVIFAMIHLGSTRSAPLAVGVVAAQVLLSLYCARAVARLKLNRAMAFSLIAVNLGLVVVGIDVIRPGTQDGYAYWAVGGAVSAAAAVALLRPLYESLPATLVIIAATDVSISHASTGGTIGANSVILLGVLAAITHRRAFAGLTPVSDNYLEQFSAAAAATERRLAIRSVEERRIAPVRNKVLPFLVAVRGRESSHADELAHDAEELQRWTRQVLSLPDFFDDQVGHLIDEAANRGVLTHVTGQNPKGPAVGLGRQLVSIALREPSVEEVKLSFVPAAQGASDLFLLLVTKSAAAADSLVERFTPVAPTLRVSAVGNLLRAQWSPKP